MTSDDVKRIFQSSDNISQYINASKLGEATVKINCVKDFTICI